VPSVFSVGATQLIVTLVMLAVGGVPPLDPEPEDAVVAPLPADEL
jgi:hypothetical protein